MRVTLQPETYSASPVSVSIPMSQEGEQKWMDAVGTAQTIQQFMSILRTIVGER